MLVFLKLLLVPAMVGLVSLASQRFGQGLAGLLSGLPVIAATVTAVLMFDASRDKVQAIAHASYAAIPASFAYTLAFAWTAHLIRHKSLSANGSWWSCLGTAALAFFAVGLGLQALALPHFTALLLALASPIIVLMLMPRLQTAAPITFQIPRTELFLRMLIAFLMAFVLLASTERLSPSLSGLVLAWPITGCVLPCFTVALYGADATVQLLKGFATGLLGFTSFFAALAWLLGTAMSPWSAYLLSLLVALAAAWSLLQLRSVGRKLRT